MRLPALVRHLALVDYSEHDDGDVTTALCGRVDRGFKHPPAALFLCRGCYRALEDEYESTVRDCSRLARAMAIARAFLRDPA